ncbi:hypothetical protein [Staphylococcus phage vB_SsapH-Golestan101-M]|nr:hypothetical protein [Staphylococcus phage vB_SsapH-Golestan101-M]
MKLVIKDRENSYLKCRYKNSEDKIVKVNLGNLIEWYPLSLAYDLKISNTGDKIQLCRLTSTLPKHYKETDTYLVDEQDYTEHFTFESVKEDNLKLKERAKEFGITFIDEDFDIEKVLMNFAKIRMIFEKVNLIVLDKYKETLNNKQLKRLIDNDLTTQIDRALSKSDDTLNNAYDELGQLYNMTVIMKKIASIGKGIGYKDRLESLQYMLKD